MATRSLGFNYEEIQRYATYAKAAYFDKHEIIKRFGDSAGIIDLPGHKIRALHHIDDRDPVQWVSIRGTANLSNVLTDVRARVVKEPRLGVYLHGGFLRAAQEAVDLISPNLDGSRQLRITGHSLGGAVAVIVAALLAEKLDGPDVGTTVTFGQPMLTDRNGIKVLSRYPLIRVVNRWDPVTALPWILARTHFELVPTIFFHHHGQQLVLHKRGAGKHTLLANLLGLVFAHRRLIANHFMDRYVERLAALTGSA